MIGSIAVWSALAITLGLADPGLSCEEVRTLHDAGQSQAQILSALRQTGPARRFYVRRCLVRTEREMQVEWIGDRGRRPRVNRPHFDLDTVTDGSELSDGPETEG